MKTYDPRSKLIRTNKSGQALVDVAVGEDTQTVAFTVPNVVIVAAVGESSSWSGQKFDGYAYLPNAEALNAFRAHLEKTKTYEEYSFIVDVSLKAITSEGLEVMRSKLTECPDRPWLWVNTDFSCKLWD